MDWFLNDNGLRHEKVKRLYIILGGRRKQDLFSLSTGNIIFKEIKTI